MGQLGFFDADKRLEALSARGDPLEAIDHLVPWESFRAEIEAVVLTPDESQEKQRWPEAVRCHPDVQDAGSTSAQQSVGRAGGSLAPMLQPGAGSISGGASGLHGI
jgi:hypothetical protein